MYLERVKSYGSNFGLYKVILIHAEDRVMDGRGKTLPDEIRTGMIVGVREIDFCGAAKGKTGRHSLDAKNTVQIYAEDLKKVDGKFNAHKWAMLNQDELDQLYRQRVAFNI